MPLRYESLSPSPFAVAAVLALAAVLSVWRGHTVRGATLLAVGAVLAAAAAARPDFALGFHRLWMGMAHLLAAINTAVLLTLVYGLIFVPYRWMGLLVRRDPLGRRVRGRESYWAPRTQTRQERTQFERLF